MGLGRNALLAAFVLTGLSSMAVSQAAFAQAPDTGAVQVADSELAITMRVDGELTFDTQGNVISHKVCFTVLPRSCLASSPSCGRWRPQPRWPGLLA